jgi:hypothetical protein
MQDFASLSKRDETVPVVASRVADHTKGIAPLGPARKAVQHCIIAGRIQLVHAELTKMCARLRGTESLQ